MRRVKEWNQIRIASQTSDVEYARAFKEERSFLRKEQRKACQVDLTDVGLGLGKVGVDRDRGVQVWRQVLDHIETTGELSVAVSRPPETYGRTSSPCPWRAPSRPVS